MRRLIGIGCVLGLTIAAAMPAAADPSPWAPAHGWRAKHSHDHAHREVRTVIFEWHTHRHQREDAHSGRRYHRHEREDAHGAWAHDPQPPYGYAEADAGYAVPPQPPLPMPDSDYCREYLISAVIGGRGEQTYGTACLQPDGAWELRR